MGGGERQCKLQRPHISHRPVEIDGAPPWSYSALTGCLVGFGELSIFNTLSSFQYGLALDLQNLVC